MHDRFSHMEDMHNCVHLLEISSYKKEDGKKLLYHISMKIVSVEKEAIHLFFASKVCGTMLTVCTTGSYSKI